MLLNMSMGLESIRKELEVCNYWRVDYYTVNGSWLKEQSLDTVEEAMSIVEKHYNNSKYRMKIEIADMCTAIRIQRYRSLAECVQTLIDAGVFNIHEYIYANDTIGLKQSAFCIRQFNGMPGELPIEITKEIDINKFNWEGFFNKYDHCTITYKNVFNTLLDKTTCYSVEDIEESFEYGDFVKFIYKKIDDRITITSYEETDVIYASEFKDKTDRAFNDYTWAHGLCAYNGGKNPVVCAQGIVNNPQWEICCAKEDELIGPFGVYVKGDVECVSNADLVSMLNIFTGQRGIDSERSKYRAKGIIFTPDELEKGQHSHGEIILTDAHVTGMWVKDWYLEESMGFKRNMQQLEQIKDILGLDSYEVVEETFNMN